jgi:hypothetical protein
VGRALRRHKDRHGKVTMIPRASGALQYAAVPHETR